MFGLNSWETGLPFDISFGSGYTADNTTGILWGSGYDTYRVPNVLDVWDWDKTLNPAPVYNKYISNFINQIKEEEKNMKTLFNVVVVDLDEKILEDKKIVAADSNEAIFLSGAYDILKAKGLKPSDVTVVVTNLGGVKVKDKPKEVKLLKE